MTFTPIDLRQRVPKKDFARTSSDFFCSVLKILMMVLAIGAWRSQAQETNHSSHTPTKNTACTNQGLLCANAATPWIQKDGTLFLVWTAGGAVMFSQSKDLGHTFTEPIELARHDQYLDTGADARAQIVANENGHVLVAYSFFKDKQWNAQINIVTSSDAGAHFNAPKPLIKSESSERFPSLSLDPSGTIHLAWIDKRWVRLQRAKGISQLGGSIAMSSTEDWGQSFKPVTLVNKESCECCRIGIDASQPNFMVVAYRAIFDNGIRDHAVQLISPQANGLTPLVHEVDRVSQDFWQTDVCPHHGPSVSASVNKTIHTVWFTQGKARQGIFYARSEDLGHHFSSPMPIGDIAQNESRPQIMTLDKDVWMVWKRFDGLHSRVMLRHSIDDGVHWSQEQAVLETAGYSDHPLLIKQAHNIYLSWFTRREGFQLVALNPLH